MQPKDTAFSNYAAIGATGNFLTIQNKDLTSYTFTLDGLTLAFNGTVAVQVLDGDTPAATWNAPTTMPWTQPAAFTGTQIVVLVITGNFLGIRLNCSAFTSGTLKATLVAK